MEESFRVLLKWYVPILPRSHRTERIIWRSLLSDGLERRQRRGRGTVLNCGLLCKAITSPEYITPIVRMSNIVCNGRQRISKEVVLAAYAFVLWCVAGRCCYQHIRFHAVKC